ncbi:MAG: HEAT repeat domain-containing protein [Candidatus Tectomicrobia bacterium]|uniref:HEAT repeat domain-containing protein n=1 Tax=Tectimicrobiota bacterium TaxID=2528274 RepID=A0A933LQN7_UNCTE|nr:HEAT repeat domain-containing protein [Candidatus Tectomicrobia bacterium]
MNRYFYPAKILLLGLLISQILAFIQVYDSNTDLSNKLSVTKEAGYLIIPNEMVRPSLQTFGAAFFGGLFFTLTVGAGLTLGTLAAVWARGRLFANNRALLICYLFFWFVSLALVNLDGFTPIVSAYFLIVPAVIFVAANRWLPSRPEKGDWFFRLFHLAIFFLLALLWVTQMKEQRFLDIRDKMLLPNAAGRAVTNFYYRYTLYAAEAFKPLEMKSLKICYLEGIKDRSIREKLAGKLLQFDYLPVSGRSEVDLEVLEEAGRLVFHHRGEGILETTTERFLLQPGEVLQVFSQQSDRYAPFRRFTVATLELASPLAFYLLLYSLFYLLLCIFLPVKKASLLSAVFCFMVGIGLLAPLLFYSQSEDIKDSNVSEKLASDSWQERVAGLKFLNNQGLGLGNLTMARKMASSPHIPERYWLARVMGHNRQPEGYQILVQLLEDSHINVACMAFEALGRRGESRAISLILPQLATTDSWYKQMYAYRALRRLGWAQSRDARKK